MTRVVCSAALTFFLCACTAEERSSPAPAKPGPVAVARTATTTIAVPVAQDVTGAYFPIDEFPAEFAELEHLSLATIDENAAPAPLNGFLRPKSRTADDYQLVKPSLEGTRLSFVTTAHKDVHYTFDGQFQVEGNFPENPPSYETVVLTGTLSRIRDGKTVASTPVRFRYEAGG